MRSTRKILKFREGRFEIGYERTFFEFFLCLTECRKYNFKIVQLSQKSEEFPFWTEIFELFKIGKFNLPTRKCAFLQCQNRQKCVQKPPLTSVFEWKIGKLCLQTTNMTILMPKIRFLFVNFLQRRFVRLVNSPRSSGRWKDFFEIVFLDNSRVLCYYIIYIWENSAQNRPIGRVCLTRLPKRFARSCSVRACVQAAAPDAKMIYDHRRETNKNSLGEEC